LYSVTDSKPLDAFSVFWRMFFDLRLWEGGVESVASPPRILNSALITDDLEMCLRRENKQSLLIAVRVELCELCVILATLVDVFIKGSESRQTV
jgi:hypothetical protein